MLAVRVEKEKAGTKVKWEIGTKKKASFSRHHWWGLVTACPDPGVWPLLQVILCLWAALKQDTNSKDVGNLASLPRYIPQSLREPLTQRNKFRDDFPNFLYISSRTKPGCGGQYFPYFLDELLFAPIHWSETQGTAPKNRVPTTTKGTFLQKRIELYPTLLLLCSVIYIKTKYFNYEAS